MSVRTLTAEQRRIVEASVDGPHLVNAGAGTGKTFTLVERAVDLIRVRGLDPEHLLLITFTKTAAAEIASRIDAAFGAQHAGRPTCGTFHAIAAALLREFAYEIGVSPDIRVVDDGRARAVFRRAFEELRAGRIAVDLSAFPLLERAEVLESDLGTLALRLKQIGRSVEAFEAGALARSGELETLAYGALVSYNQAVKKELRLKKGWPKPDPERTPDERRDEADRERRNIRVVAALLRRFEALLDAEALLTYGDVLNRAIAMLAEHPEIRATLQRRWRHAIVDEFQDTNPTQIAFLKAIFGADLRPVLAVGDVRQAIFSFQGADPQGIVALGALAGCTTYPLTENRRSYQRILDVAHHALLENGGVPTHLHQPLSAHRGDVAQLQVYCDIFDGEDALEREGAAVADTIRGLLDRGVSPRECAILLRSRKRAAIYADALRARGVAVQLVGGVGFFDAPDVREALAWLRLVDAPDDAAAVVAALQGAAIGLGDGAVAHLAATGSVARAAVIEPMPVTFHPDERERLERFRAITAIACGLADAGLVAAVRAIVAAAGIDVARSADPAAADQARANMEKLVRLAADLAHDRPLARVRDLLAELAVREEHGPDLPVAELEGERVAIMTIHGAKGLEWSHVFLCNTSPRTFPAQAHGGEEAIRYDEDRGTLALQHGIDGRPTFRWLLARYLHDENGLVLAEPADETRRDEEFRLLYVALTRARDAIYVSGRSFTNQTSKCAQAVQAWIVANGGDLETHRLPALPAPVPSDGAAAVVADDVAEVRALQRLARVAAAETAPPERRGTLSYSAMELHERCPRRARYHYVLGLPDLSDDAGFASAFSGAGGGEEREPRDPARFGRIVHKVLEYEARARLAGAKRDLERFVNDAVEEEAGTPVEAAAAQVAGAAASAVLDRYAPIDAERRFTVAIDGVGLAGYIDLIARDEAGRLVVVDYKTGTTAGEHYALQFALYARAVSEELGEAPRTLLLRIAGEQVQADEIVPASDAELCAAVAAARTMESDEPRPGPGCRLCPYAHDVCQDAPQFAREGSPT